MNSGDKDGGQSGWVDVGITLTLIAAPIVIGYLEEWFEADLSWVRVLCDIARKTRTG